MSKSVGNVVSPADLVSTYGLDPVRYFFLRETPWGQDGNYSHELIVARMNADLANDLGNLARARCPSSPATAPPSPRPPRRRRPTSKCSRRPTRWRTARAAT